jgi:hypothetical protein
MRFVDKLVRFWKDRVVGPRLGSYDRSVEELGGVPWIAKGDTERWFLPPTGNTDKPATLDTNALRIWSPTIIDRLRQSPKLSILGGGVVSFLLVFTLIKSFSTGSTAQAAPVAPRAAVTQTIAPAPVPAPAADPAPISAPAKALKANMSPSVKALFSGKSSGTNKPAKARPAKRIKKGKRR